MGVACITRGGNERNIWNTSILVVKIEGKDHLDVDVKKKIKIDHRGVGFDDVVLI